MPEKGSYSQQDVDYAFSLGMKELNGRTAGSLIEHSMSNIYKSLILEKIFGGMKERCLNHITLENAQDDAAIQEWLENDLYECFTRKKDDVLAVLRALKRNSEEPDPDAEYLMFVFKNLLVDNWFEKVFVDKAAPENSPLHGSKNRVMAGLNLVFENNASRTKALVETLIKYVIAEDKIKSPDSLQKAKNNK